MRRLSLVLALVSAAACDFQSAQSDGPVPVAPASLTVRRISDTAVSLSWSPDPASWGFRVERALSIDGPWTMVASIAPEAGSTLDQGLDPSRSYYYVIRAFNGAGYSAPSNVAVAGSPEPPEPDAGNDPTDAGNDPTDAGYQPPDAGPPANLAPTVSLTSPNGGTSRPAPAAFTLTANATDSDGTISKVEFYQGLTLLSTVSAAPYSYNWTNVVAGSYALTAKAYDNLGKSTFSATVNVTVTPPPAFSVASITVINADTNLPIAEFDPLENGDVIDSAMFPNITLRANVAGNVGSVRFALDGNANARTENTAPYLIAPEPVAGDPDPYPLAQGAHTVTGTPFELDNVGGVQGNALVRNFTFQ